MASHQTKIAAPFKPAVTRLVDRDAAHSAVLLCLRSPSRLTRQHQPADKITMSKSQDSRKQVRKQPLKTLKEKKQAKLAKKQGR